MHPHSVCFLLRIRFPLTPTCTRTGLTRQTRSADVCVQAAARRRQSGTQRIPGTQDKYPFHPCAARSGHTCLFSCLFLCFWFQTLGAFCMHLLLHTLHAFMLSRSMHLMCLCWCFCRLRDRSGVWKRCMVCTTMICSSFPVWMLSHSLRLSSVFPACRTRCLKRSVCSFLYFLRRLGLGELPAAARS